jgi:hypothetical protein
MMLAETGLPINIQEFISDPPTALLIIFLSIAVVGAIRGWWIPKFVYDEKDKREQAQTKVNSEMTQAVKDMTTAFKELTSEIRQRGRDDR